MNEFIKIIKNNKNKIIIILILIMVYSMQDRTQDENYTIDIDDQEEINQIIYNSSNSDEEINKLLLTINNDEDEQEYMQLKGR